MNLFENYSLGNRKRYIEKRTLKKIGVISLLCFMIISNFICIQNYKSNHDFSNNTILNNTDTLKEINPIIPKCSDNPSELQDPFTKNFSNIWDYFNLNFKSGLTKYEIDTYIRSKDSGGSTVDNGVYSLDNLLLYNSLLDFNYDQNETFTAYNKLKTTPLWYKNDASEFEYGFIGTIDGTTGDITDHNRYLIDNVMPIFLLLEDGTQDLDDITYHGETAKDAIEDTFLLINSTQFYNISDNGFLNFNSTSSGSIYQMKSNFYTILAYYTIYRNWAYIKSSAFSINDVYNTANSVMETFIEKMWDNQEKGFYKSAGKNWNIGTSIEDTWKFLDVNALGILALLDYWIENEEMNTDSLYFKNATLLYNKLNANMWSSGRGAYIYARNIDWSSLFPANNPYNRYDLEANALMMQACLKLFEVTGNITYYNRAFEIYNTFETKMYDSANNAYITSFHPSASDNTNLNFTSNLKLIEIYLKAFEIYNSTVIDANFNITGKVDYIVNQEAINLTCDYAFEKKISYSRPTQGTNITRYNNITGGVITYILRYPNETIIDIIRDDILDNTTTFIYPVTDKLPFGNGYTIKIKANSSYFGVAFANKIFNVKSGLVVKEIVGLDEIDEEDEFFQGQTRYFNISIESFYNYNLTLNVSIEAFGVINYTRYNLIFVNNSETLLELNVSALNSAVKGLRPLIISFKDGAILYLEEIGNIFISDALTYSNLLYDKEVAQGNSIQVSLQLINYLPHNNQSLNITFTSEYVIGQKIFSYTLYESEVRTILTSVSVSGNIDVDSFEITMKILKGNTVIKSEILTINVISKLEIVSINYPEKVTQGVPAKLILIIKNNQESPQEFTLIINDNKIKTNIEELVSGENRIEVEVLPTINPYEIGNKKFYIELEDENDDVIVEDYFESEIQLSAINLLLFYILPIAIPIGVILHYKNKEIKIKLLRR
ncbi:MAG: hypothetical protein ACFFDK_10500 [Promethearchaeota archaeon]